MFDFHKNVIFSNYLYLLHYKLYACISNRSVTAYTLVCIGIAICIYAYRLIYIEDNEK